MVRDCGEKAIETYREKAVKARRCRSVSYRTLMRLLHALILGRQSAQPLSNT